MAKNKVKSTKEKSEIAPVEKSDEVLTVVKTKPTKEDKAKLKEDKKAKNKTAKKVKNKKPRRNFIKEIFSELKKVSWPSFKTACKQTGTVLVVVAVFMVIVLGIDLLLGLLFSKVLVGIF